KEIHAASLTADRSRIPKSAAIIYPEIIPIKIGMIFRKPRKVTQQIIVMTNVSSATVASVGSIVQVAGSTPSCGIQPDIPAATGTSSSPITATIAPIAAGGKIISNQVVPATFTIHATKVKTIPTAKNPPKAYP